MRPVQVINHLLDVCLPVFGPIVPGWPDLSCFVAIEFVYLMKARVLKELKNLIFVFCLGFDWILSKLKFSYYFCYGDIISLCQGLLLVLHSYYEKKFEEIRFRMFSCILWIYWSRKFGTRPALCSGVNKFSESSKFVHMTSSWMAFTKKFMQACIKRSNFLLKCS